MHAIIGFFKAIINGRGYTCSAGSNLRSGTLHSKNQRQLELVKKIIQNSPITHLKLVDLL